MGRPPPQRVLLFPFDDGEACPPFPLPAVPASRTPGKPGAPGLDAPRPPRRGAAGGGHGRRRQRGRGRIAAQRREYEREGKYERERPVARPVRNSLKFCGEKVTVVGASASSIYFLTNINNFMSPQSPKGHSTLGVHGARSGHISARSGKRKVLNFIEDSHEGQESTRTTHIKKHVD